DTVTVFIESAWFDPYVTAKPGRALDIISDARYRFERGVDPDFTVEGADIATALVMELCGGKPSEAVIAGKAPDVTREIDFDPAYTRKLGGIDIPEKEQLAILEKLGFEV